MNDKNLGLALFVPGIWVTSIVWFVVFTLFSPIIFLTVLFGRPFDEIIAEIQDALPVIEL